MDEEKVETTAHDKPSEDPIEHSSRYANEPTSPTPEDLAKSPDVVEEELEDIQLDRTDDAADCQTARTFAYPDQAVTDTEVAEPQPEAASEDTPSDGNEQHTQTQEPTSSSISATPERHRTTVIHSTGESVEETFARLKEGALSGEMSQKDIVDGLFNVLVGGMFDPESRFIIENSAAIIKFVDVLDACPSSLQAEIWSVFVAIVRKNFRNLEACSRVGLISICLDKLPHADSVISDLLVQLLSVLTSYSITVKETKHFLRALQASDGVWRRNSAKLLSVMQEMPKREGADVFFSFPGVASAGLALPPLTKWPYQNGWTFSTWLRMDPLNSVNFEKETPYLFSFASAKGLGYYCYFMGNCLVLKCVRAPGKEMTRCIKQELSPRRWHHVAISFIYSRWGQSEIQCFVDGQLAESIDSNWSVSTNDHFDRCFVGCGTESDVNEAFCGQMGAVYVFSQSLAVQQANCLYCLGAAYQSHFKHDAESNLPEGYKKHLFDGRLHSALVFAYCPKNCHGQLCLFPAPKTNPYFVQVPHAIMKMGVEVITSHSIHNSLHSVGGIQMLLPLFAQIDMPHEGREPPVDYAICSSLLSVISLLMNTSSSAQQQLFHSQGFLIIAHVLNSSSEKHLTLNVLEAFIDMAKFLLTCPAGIPLLKQLFDHIFFSPQLWIRTDASIQLRLYKYLANEFVSNANYISIVQRTATIAELMHAIKAYYWIEPPRPAGGAVKTEGQRLSRTAIVEIRALILQVVDHMMFHSPPGCDEKDLNRDEEVQIMFNFISTVGEDDNLYDILSQTMRQMNDHPAVLVPAFDKKRGLCVVFNLVASGNELVRIPALKIFGYFICRSTMKRKNEAINNLNLLHLLSDKLLLNSRFLTLATYNVLFEILIEQVSPDILFVKHEDPPVEGTTFENPSMLKVIANLIAQSEETPELLRVKKVFLTDIIRLCRDSKENRRTILQMSVWQEWLIALAYVFPENNAQEEISDLVYELFAILLFHAIRLEFGGWRVWVDTLAIAHSKVSWDRYRLKLRKAQETKTEEDAQKAVADAVNGMVASTVEAMEGSETSTKSEQQPLSAKRRAESANDTPSSLYRTPEFSWSDVHVRLLNDLLTSIEQVVDQWNESANLLVDHTNNSDNQVFISNTVHVLSQLTDSLIMACGGLLPLLAAATSPTSELEIADSTQQELTMENAVQFLVRFAELADVFIFVSGISFSELEQEKNMPNGGILRQTLRLVSTMAVRNILACRLMQQDRGFVELANKHPAKYNAIRKFVDKANEVKDASKGITDVDRLLQEVDLQRLKSIVYRDMDESRQAQFLALAVVYLLSVLMVSRYRDILEPPTSPSPFFDTNSDSSARKISADSVGERKATVNGGSQLPAVPNGVSKGVSTASDDESESTAREIVREEVEEEQGPDGVSSIRFRETPTPQSQPEKYHTDHLAHFQSPDMSNMKGGSAPADCRAYLTTKLQKSLESVAPLLREIMTDFRPFLQKTLLGTHGQEILDPKVMQTLKNPNGSVIELVMLLCSQEWQTSLQKHAGLAFIELVNEGRLMAHATRDHILRVANEADFILNRLRAEDVSKHAQFDSESGDELRSRKREEQISNHLISSSRRRDFTVAYKLLEKMRTILLSPSGAWSSKDEMKRQFWRLDSWEDDSRRRKRFVPNVYGCQHSMASLRRTERHEESAEEEEKERETLLKDLAQKVQATGQTRPTAVSDLVDESDIDKWSSEENDLREPRQEQASYSTEGKLIAPGVVVPGTISITSTDVYFDSDEDDPLFKQQDPKCIRYCDNLHGRWHFQEIRAIFLRRYMLQYTSLELFLASRTAIMFAFPDQEVVKKVVEHLPRVGVGVKYGLPQSRKTSLMSPRQLFKHSDMPQKWQRREISNFDYLMFLNTIAGRTFNDLNQYPIFPWVLANYASEKLDLSEASNFRDLSKPVGALSESRRKYFQERFNNWDDPSVPAFHYGTHYSTQAFTLNWLMRVEPFTTFFLHLQSGKFDHSDRLFHSMSEAWERCQRDTHDVKELIPELFYMPEMYCNSNGYDLGKRENGTPVDDVVLPPWATSPEQFVTVHRQALESDLVSCQLNQWIDLIFGYKQRGPEAVRSTNVFYYLTYEGAVNLNAIEDPAIRQGIEQQILNFGQTPVQLMVDPHPPRHSIMTMSPLMFQPCHDDLCMLMKFISNSPIVHLSANTFPQLQNPTVLSVSQNLVFALNKWNTNYIQHSQSTSALGSSIATDKNTSDSIAPNDLPLTVDPLLAVGNPSQPPPKRHLGDAFDQRLNITWSNFVTTNDSSCIIACGYPDYSFRVISTDSATVKQVIYGHGDVVTCLARSEPSLYSDCYVASGSLDCTVVLWHFSQQYQAIAGEYNVPGETPAPRAILTGHEAEIAAVFVSAEHGIVISGSKDGNVLIHTTQGDLLRRIFCQDFASDSAAASLPITNILMSRDCRLAIFYGQEFLSTFTTTGKQLSVPAHRFTNERVLCATLSRDGDYIVFGTDTGRISIARMFPLEHLYTFPQTDSAIRSVTISTNQRFILGGLDSGAVVVFNVDFNKWHFEYKQRYAHR